MSALIRLFALDFLLLVLVWNVFQPFVHFFGLPLQLVGLRTLRDTPTA
jgi:hypothetical protein